MGGNLIIIADFEDRKVELSHIGKAGDFNGKKVRRQKALAAKARALHSRSAYSNERCSCLAVLSKPEGNINRSPIFHLFSN
jgi:hypothetical protein